MQGNYYFRTVQPLGYMIPLDGPVGALVLAQKRHGYRPAHIHFLIGAPGHRELVACREFQRQSARKKQKLLVLIVKAAAWKDGHLDVTLQEPFRTLLLSNSATSTKDEAKGRSEAKIEAWLGILDTFRTVAAQNATWMHP